MLLPLVEAEEEVIEDVSAAEQETCRVRIEPDTHLDVLILHMEGYAAFVGIAAAVHARQRDDFATRQSDAEEARDGCRKD